MKNNYASRIIRTITSPLPIKRGRKGICVRCGECCKLPKPCLFLGYDKEDKPICRVYRFRPLNCRKYPRSEQEHITKETCGFYFENDRARKI